LYSPNNIFAGWSDITWGWWEMRNLIRYQGWSDMKRVLCVCVYVCWGGFLLNWLSWILWVPSLDEFLRKCIDGSWEGSVAWLKQRIFLSACTYTFTYPSVFLPPSVFFPFCYYFPLWNIATYLCLEMRIFSSVSLGLCFGRLEGQKWVYSNIRLAIALM
jgi:hypothetical protein